MGIGISQNKSFSIVPEILALTEIFELPSTSPAYSRIFTHKTLLKLGAFSMKETTSSRTQSAFELESYKACVHRPRSPDEADRRLKSSEAGGVNLINDDRDNKVQMMASA